MTDPRLTHRAKIVAELTERLGNAFDGTDEDAGFLASQLEAEAKDLESLCLYALREARIAKAMAEGVKQIEADNRTRRERLERRAEKIREAVAMAMAEAGLPKITSDDLTVSFREGDAPLVIDRDPTEQDHYDGLATKKTVYSWDKYTLRCAVQECGEDIKFARFGNPQPSIVVRAK